MKKRKVISTILSLTLAWPIAASAQEPPALLEEIVVSATKTKEKREDVPNSVIILDRYDLEESPARSIGEFLAGESGVDWRTRGNYGGASESIQIRGMAGDETRVLVNGVSYNSPSLGSADLAAIPLNAIERIEVVKGAASLLYGSGAMAGTANLTTKRPQRGETALIANAGLGSQGSNQLAAEHGLFLTEHLGYYLTATRKESDGFRENSDLAHHDASLNLIYDRGEQLNISLYGDLINREFGVPGIRPPAGTGDHYVGGVRYYSAEAASLVNRGESRDRHAVLEIKSSPFSWLSLRGQGDYTSMKSFDYERFNADSWTSLAGEGRKTYVHNRVLGVEGNAEFKPMANFSLLTGIDYKNHDWDTAETSLDTSGAPTGSDSANKARLYSKGVFAEIQYRPADWLKLLTGLRQESHSTFGKETLPHFGLVVTPAAGTTIKGSHGKHFKAPTPNDLFWPENDFVRGNPDLKAQTGWHSDLTLEQKLAGDRLTASLSAFHWSVDGKITWAMNPAFPGPYGDKWTPTNLNQSNGKGFEAGLRYRPFPALDLSLDYTYTEAEDETALVVRSAQYVPTHQGKAAATWRHNCGLTTGVVIRYLDERPFYQSAADRNPTEMLDSAVTVDLRLRRKFKEHFSLTLDANNLFDADYDTYAGTFINGSGSQVSGRYPAAGRSVFLGLGYEF